METILRQLLFTSIDNSAISTSPIYKEFRDNNRAKSVSQEPLDVENLIRMYHQLPPIKPDIFRE